MTGRLVVMFFLMALVVAHAGVILLFTPPMVTVPAGTTATYYGTLSNDGPDDAYLNATLSVLPFVGLSLDARPLLCEYAGRAGAQPDVPGCAVYGVRLIDDGAGCVRRFLHRPGRRRVVFSYSDLATQNFQASVVAVPEPGYFAPIVGAIALSTARRRAIGPPVFRRFPRY